MRFRQNLVRAIIDALGEFRAAGVRAVILRAAAGARVWSAGHDVAELEAFTRGLAAQIAANAPLAIGVMKEQLRILAGARPMSPQGFERVQGLRRVVYDSDDYQEGIRAFKEKRKPVFEGK